MLGNRLKALRIERRKTQEDMAKLLGITRQAYGKYEIGKADPDNETLKKLAEYFNVSTDYLLGRTNVKDKGEMYFFDKENWTEQEMKEAIEYIEFRRKMKEKNDK